MVCMLNKSFFVIFQVPLIVIGILVSNVFSAPAISSSDNTVNSGEYFTIRGSSFFSGDNSPLLWENFESGTNGNSLNAEPTVGSWVHISNPTPTIYSNNFSHSGSQSAYTEDGGYGNVRVNNLENHSRIYWSFWFRYDNNNCSSCQTKLVQLWGNGPDRCDYGPGFMSGGFAGTWFASYNIASGDDCSTGKVQTSYGSTPSQNSWHLAEVILKRSSDYGVADGTIILRIDNRDMYSMVGNSLTRMNGQDWRSALFFYGFTNNGGLGNFSIDDAYINNSWARVMLGNASRYASCTVLDVQPVVEWSEGEIIVAANTGAYQTGQNAYLYVIDATGAISESRQVTIGSTSGGGSTPVPTPTPTPVTPEPVPSDSAWNADSNMGGAWFDSSVAYCVRLLIPGEQITQSGNTVKLGFQGRSSGSYRIRSVSIAQRDSYGNVGDIINSTWKKVTFDKHSETYLGEPLIANSWEYYEVVVPQGTEKISNPIKFNIQKGQDYYVTFKIVTPSVYQNAPSGYSELYFSSADHTQSLDWAGTGFSNAQDYHALSNIYITNEVLSPAVPIFK